MWNDTVIEAVRRAKGNALKLESTVSMALNISTLETRRSAVSRILAAFKYLPFDERQKNVEALAAAVDLRLPSDLMMTSDQVLELVRNGMEIGAHTVNHPILAKIDDERGDAEIKNGKRQLESLTGSSVRLFAYPNGKPGTDYLAPHVGMVRQAGFEGAVSTSWGVATPRSDIYQLPRFTPWDKTPAKFLGRMIANTFRTTSAVV
jgi:peptidoglycan/xylan/chitin deacetylase (PgdA/CDA1 family)